MNRLAVILVVLLAALAVAATGCTSRKNSEETPAARTPEATVTEGTEESGDVEGEGTREGILRPGGWVGPASHMPPAATGPESFWGTESVVTVSSEAFIFTTRPDPEVLAELPSSCETLSGQTLGFLRDTITVSRTSTDLGYIVRGEPDGGLSFIVAILNHPAPSQSGDGSFAVWATLGSDGAVSYDNTWAANGVAAEYSSLPQGSGLEAVYSQFPAYQQALACAELVYSTSTIVRVTTAQALSQLFNIEAIANNAASYEPLTTADCKSPDADVPGAIEDSLTGQAMGLAATGMAPSRLHGDTPALWHIVADLDGPGLEGPGPIAVWITGIDENGIAFIYAANPAAQQFSSFPSTASVEDFPGLVGGYAQAAECMRLAQGRE